MENAFPPESFQWKQDYLFKIPLIPGKFSVGRTENVCSINIPTGISGILGEWKAPQISTYSRKFPKGTPVKRMFHFDHLSDSKQHQGSSFLDQILSRSRLNSDIFNLALVFLCCVQRRLQSALRRCRGSRTGYHDHRGFLWLCIALRAKSDISTYFKSFIGSSYFQKKLDFTGSCGWEG